MVRCCGRWCVAPTIAAATLIAGCGGASHTVAAHTTASHTVAAHTTASHTVAAHTAPKPQLTRGMVQAGKMLVFFKRVVGADPLASQLTIDTNGLSDAMITLGGIEGNKEQVFRLSLATLRRLRRLLHATHLHSTSCCSALSYIYWVMEGGRSWQLQQGRVPLNMRPLILTLDGITNVHTVF